mmetsp:Transcript_596/g.1319  ORF Transcript_596/g.1319 Transcript_596/m.1319 type:complete len:119 (-) Transcript_596:313-669(-)
MMGKDTAKDAARLKLIPPGTLSLLSAQLVPMVSSSSCSSFRSLPTNENLERIPQPRQKPVSQGGAAFIQKSQAVKVVLKQNHSQATGGKGKPVRLAKTRGREAVGEEKQQARQLKRNG